MKCFGLVFPGGRHPCTTESLRGNIRKLVPQKSLEIIASDILKEKGKNGEVATLATRGSKTAYVRADRNYNKIVQESKRTISLDSLHRAKASTGISDNMLKAVVREIRGNVPIEPGLRDSLTRVNKFAKMFESSLEELDNGSKVPVVFCKSPASFFSSIMTERAAENENVILRLSVDEGHGFLKVRN